MLGYQLVFFSQDNHKMRISWIRYFCQVLTKIRKSTWVCTLFWINIFGQRTYTNVVHTLWDFPMILNFVLKNRQIFINLSKITNLQTWIFRLKVQFQKGVWNTRTNLRHQVIWCKEKHIIVIAVLSKRCCSTLCPSLTTLQLPEDKLFLKWDFSFGVCRLLLQMLEFCFLSNLVCGNKLSSSVHTLIPLRT